MKSKITIIELAAKKINNDLIAFDLGDVTTGVIHISDNGPATVVLDGGYVLSESHCFACAMETIGGFMANYLKAQNDYPTSYAEHKKLHMN
ncbi:hypothetical protein [Yokenella regensburgei]|uniref:hypothetical protein n=1 Tax=Yokenella regensburgei TaxID=158877 RepID=UPI0031DE91A2